MCATQVIVVRAASGDIAVECGGVPMTRPDAAADPALAAAANTGARPGFDSGTDLGKRYTDDATGLVVLSITAGGGSLSADGRLLTRLAPKPLPASD
ncbi:MAG: hypothetical protein ACQSGP_30520 [Frankia sp.]